MLKFIPARSTSGAAARSRANALITAALVASGTVGLLVGCGGTGAGQAPAPTQTAPSVAPQVSLSPGDTTLAVGTHLALMATQSGVTDSDVVWSVNGITGGSAAVGTITGTGGAVTYTAPTAVGTYTVTVACPGNLSNNASSTLTVLAAGTVIVSVNPATASVNTGGTTALTATVGGNSDTAVSWTVDGIANGNTTVGTITGTGAAVTYTAPATAGGHTVTATSVADTSKSASTVITVQAAASAVSVAMTPLSANLNAGGTTSITATVGGSSNSAVTWTVDGIANGNAMVGMLTGSGASMTYTAPAAAGNHTVMATSVADPAVNSTTLISVQASTGTAAVSLTHPGSSTVNRSGSMLFTATVTGSSNSSVTWAVDGVANGNATVGTVTSGTGNNTALYQAPAATGSHTVTAISAADASRTASSAVTVASAAYTVVNPNNVYNVKTGFGATGNGSSDDTASIQNAINAASSAGGGLVEVPAGTYMINLAYQMGEVGLLMKSNVTLQLDAGSVIKAKSGAPGTSYMIMFSGGSNMNIVGPGTLDGNKASIGLHEGVENIGFWGASNVVLTGFTSQNAPGDGIYINGYPSGAGVGSPVSNVLIYNVTCTTNGRNGMSPDGCDGLIVRDSTFSNQTSANPGNGIDCEPINGQAPNNFNIFNCVFSGNAGGGIQSGPCDVGDNATFTNMTYAFNTVTNCGDYGIEAQNGAGPVYILNNNVSGTFTGTGAFTSYTGHGIMTRGQSGIRNVTVSGNTVTTSKGDGILMASSSASTCSYNTVTSSVGKGINNQSGSGVTVSNNTLSGNTGGN